VGRLLLMMMGTGVLLLLPGRLAAADKLKLADGDRVVLVGNTLIEREQRYGYWETALTSHYHDKRIIFRNLGWSGDTVFGDAQARFGTAADGFKHLKEHVHALKPTVIIAGYGLNESFKGKAGLPEFLKGLDALLDMLAQTKARIVLLSPLRQEDLGRPLPDPTEQNKNLQMYRDALRKVADKRGDPFVDLFDLPGRTTRGKPAAPLTDNGIHLTAFGYWRTTETVANELGLERPRWRVTLDGKGNSAAQGARVVLDKRNPLSFKVTDAELPVPPLPPRAPVKVPPADLERVLHVKGLAPGKYVLKIDGKVMMSAGAEAWAAGVKLRRGPEIDQVEQLRQAILRKNRLYFHRWRPQNETYLFGFRKHEQGKNAREIVQFDPLIAKVETEIARLRVPVSHQYDLIPEREKK